MLLLVVFFVMLIAYSAIDKERWLKKKCVEGKIKEAPAEVDGIANARHSMEQLAGGMGLGLDYPVVPTPEGFKAVLPAPLLFTSGSADFNLDVYPILDNLIEIIRQNNLEVQIEGHTDNVPIHSARYPSNWELSAMRAVNILRYLQNFGSISPNRLIAVGFGEHQPVADNKTEEGRRMNRRIEIYFRQVK